jgi:ribonucleoside-triphosphate reductase
MNEACLNAPWLRVNLGSKDAQAFAKDVLNHMRERLVIYQEQYGDLYNLEATPAESTAYRLAKHDKEKYPDIITASENDERPFYTNSSHLPVGFTDDIFEALDIQDDLQVLYTSGTVFHAFLGEKLPNWQAAAKLVRTIATNYKLPYYTISPTYSICQDHGYFAGEVDTCPICGKPTEVWSRITGYYRPISNWNAGKSQEWEERVTYDMGEKVHSGRDFVKQTQKRKTPISSNRYLFTTPTCPNCKIVQEMLKKRGVDYQLIDATKEVDLAKRYDIMRAPTLIVDHDEHYEQYSDLSDIRQYIEGLTA